MRCDCVRPSAMRLVTLLCDAYVYSRLRGKCDVKMRAVAAMKMRSLAAMKMRYVCSLSLGGVYAALLSSSMLDDEINQ
jgi:hypothetical protein